MKKQTVNVMTSIMFAAMGIVDSVCLWLIFTDWQVEYAVAAGICFFVIAAYVVWIIGSIVLAFLYYIRAERRRKMCLERRRREKKAFEIMGIKVGRHIPGTDLYEEVE